MPRISNFIYCEESNNAQSSNGEKLNIIGLLQFLLPPVLPSTFSFTVVVGIVDMDFGANHSFRYVFKGREGNVIADTGITELPPPSENDNLQNGIQGVQLSFDLRNVLLNSEGLHSSEIYIDDELLGSYPISVRINSQQ